MVAACEPAKLRTPLLCCLLSSFLALFYIHFLFLLFARGYYAVSSASVAICSAYY